MAKGWDLEGFGDLDLQLGRLRPATGKAALKRALRTAAQPMADLMISLAPDDPSTPAPDLKSGIIVSDKLSTRQASLHRRTDRAAVEMFVGPGPDPAATQQEFGNVNHGPQAFARPAWDQDKDLLLQRLADEMRKEISASLSRVAARGR